MPSPFRFDRSWHFGVRPDELWATLTCTDRYREWWPWLREFTLADARKALTQGAAADILIQAPLPYQIRCSIRVVDAEPARKLTTLVDGDLRGPARLELQPSAEGSDVRLAWELNLRAPLLRSMALVARPAMAWGHDRIVERGLEQFEQHALSDRERDRRSEASGNV